MDGQATHDRASRSGRHISIIACITTAGKFLTPYIVTLQDSDAIRERLVNRGVRLDVDCVSPHRSKPYVSGRLFLEYINTVFVPYLNEL
jgi:hypothetical protein